TVAGVAADALALLAYVLGQVDAKRHREGLVAERLHCADELRDRRLVAHGGERVRRAGSRLGRVGAPEPVDLVEALRLRVEGLELVVPDGPREGFAAVV